ncbi:hypothetical protein D9C73_006080 [Collichthys lucidus]|uniref:Uncharacterized protein n=1 Tax=Collichthys lucidus TaxID=240159 RepID=A0A4U5UC16_COLLU|nr:hypothetical protein D9C73_006080 [Collichthys lucidus]
MVGIHSDIGLLHDQQGDIALQLLPVLLPTVTYKIRRKVYRPSNPEVRRAFIDIQPAFVIIGGIALEHPSLLGSVDGCFKAFFVFDINYPKPCAQVWEFIQACIFEIPGHESNAVKLIRIQPSFSLAVFDIMSGRCDRLPNWDLIEFAHSAASSSHPGPAMEQKQLKLAGCARPHTLSSLPVNSGHISYLIRLSVNVTGNHKALKSYQEESERKRREEKVEDKKNKSAGRQIEYNHWNILPYSPGNEVFSSAGETRLRDSSTAAAGEREREGEDGKRGRSSASWQRRLIGGLSGRDGEEKQRGG